MAGHERVIGASAALEERGTGLRFVVERDGRAQPAFAVRVDGIVRAYLNACAHQGVELDWEQGAFFDDERRHLVCATHGASYEAADGRCAGGPCRGRGLLPLSVVERNGAIVLLADG